MLASFFGAAHDGAANEEEDVEEVGASDTGRDDGYETLRGGALANLATRLAGVVERLQGVPLGEELADIAQRLQEEAEAEDLWVEAEELRLKLEALRAADYRDQLRAAVAASVPGAAPNACGVGGVGGATSSSAAGADGNATVEHYNLDDGVPGYGEDRDDLDAMYDFSRFGPGTSNGVPAGSTADVRGESSSSASTAGARRLRMVEARLREREAALAMDLKARDQKLSAASRALHRTRAHNQQLTAQLGLKELQGSRLEAQVTQLRNLLVEKERRLQGALDETAACQQQHKQQHQLLQRQAADIAAAQQQQARAEEEARSAREFAAALASTGAAAAADAETPNSTHLAAASSIPPTLAAQQALAESADAHLGQQPLSPGIAPGHDTAALSEPTPPPLAFELAPAAVEPVLELLSPPVEKKQDVVESEQLAHLSSVMEELAEALETARDAEERAREELAATSELLKAEQALRELREQDLQGARELLDARAAELEPLRKAAAKLRQMEERTAREQLEAQIQKALRQKGRSKQKDYHPHFEV